ncbi:MAG: helix-turn-helix transcriptional regulator [Nonlabens sp.]
MSNQNLYRGSLTTIIMRLLEQEERMYGYEITQKVKEVTKESLNIKEGALYPALHKLQAEGYLSVEAERVNNRVRKYYKLTESGEKETANKLQELRQYIEDMQLVINPKLSY